MTQWLLTNAREFSAELARVGRPNWPQLARVLYEKRSVGGRDGPVTGRALRDTWYRVRLYLRDRGEGWVEIKDPPRGMPRKGRRRKVVRSPVGAVDPAQAKEAAPAPASSEPVPSSIEEVLRQAAKERPWVTTGRKD